MPSQSTLFTSISRDLETDLKRLNPWWSNLPGKVLPNTRRHLVGIIQRRLDTNLAPIVIVRGPRQIGKTTAQEQVVADFLNAGIAPTSILRVQFDEIPALENMAEPILRIVEWFEARILGRTLNEAAHAGIKTYLFFDEVQNLQDWAPQLKHLVDSTTTQVVVTGSSALRIELGRDSLAGRITTIECGVLSLTEISRFHGVGLDEPYLPDNGLEPLGIMDFWRSLAEYGRANAARRDLLFDKFSKFGGYPLAHVARHIEWHQIADQLNETIIKRVISHDLRVGERGRKRDAMLLEEVFRLACRYAGQYPQPALLASECRGSVNANIGEQRVRHYLQFLADTLLIRLVDPLEIRLKKRRSAPKICLADHALRASWLQEVVPLTPQELGSNPHLSPIAGRIAESTVGATLASVSGLDITHSPVRGIEPEIDFVVTVGTKRIPVEVKYQRRINEVEDTSALRRFLEKSANNSPFSILVTQSDETTVNDPRIVCIPLSSLMLIR